MRKWTQSERKQQAELIHNWQPWNNSTGAKTPEGKAISKMNALKFGLYTRELRLLKALLSEQNMNLMNY